MNVSKWGDGFALALVIFVPLLTLNSPAWSQQFDIPSPGASPVGVPVSPLPRSADLASPNSKVAGDTGAETVPANAKARFSDDGRLLVDNELLELLDLDQEIELDATGRLFELETNRWLRENDARYRKVMEFVEFFNATKKRSPSNRVAAKQTNSVATFPIQGPIYSTPAPNAYRGQQLPTFAPSPPYVPQSNPATTEAMIIDEMKAMRVALESQARLLDETQAKVDQLAESLKKLGQKKSRPKKKDKK